MNDPTHVVSKSQDMDASTDLNLIHFEDLPGDIIDEIIFWLSVGQVNLHSSSKTLIDISNPNFTYNLNRVRCGSAYDDLISLSSTCSFFRQKLGPVLFRNASLIRENQIDSVLSSLKRMELFSDKKTYQRQFLKELLETNILNCSTTELARTSFRDYILGDRQFKSKYQTQFSINNFITYLECDNSCLRHETISLFPALEELKVLDEACDELNPEQFDIPRLRSLAINARTLVETPSLLSHLSRVRRLDLLLDYREIVMGTGIRTIIDKIKEANNIRHLVLMLNNEFAIYYAETIELLENILDKGKLSLLSIRTKRRKSYVESRSNNIQFPLFKGYIGDKIVLFINNTEELLLDMNILGALIFPPDAHSIEAPAVRRNSLSKRTLTLVDPVLSIQFSASVKDNILALMRQNLFTEFNLQYGESLADEHHQVLKLITDFVYNMSLHETRPYSGLSQISIEKCWSISDDSIKREYLGNLIKELTESKSSQKREIVQHRISSTTIWSTTPFNSPRYRIRDAYRVIYDREITEVNRAVKNVIFIPIEEQSMNRSFWSVETSLAEFEQYSIHQRRSMLWD